MYMQPRIDGIRQPSLEKVQNDYPINYKTRHSMKGNQPPMNRRSIVPECPQNKQNIRATLARLENDRSQSKIIEKQTVMSEKLFEVKNDFTNN